MEACWPEGPRDWSPRITWALREAARLRTMLPQDLLTEEEGFWETGKTYLVAADGNLMLATIAVMIQPLSRLQHHPDRVWVYPNGFVYVDEAIYRLLTGKIEGYEAFKGRWPWPSPYGPPHPWREKRILIFSDGSFEWHK